MTSPGKLQTLILAMVITVLAGVAQAEPVMIEGSAIAVDGDTIDIGPVRIRIHGIDAPETGQRCDLGDEQTWNCSRRARRELDRLISGKTVACEALDRDPYGRIISRCGVDGRDIGTELVGAGLAWAFRRFSDDYVEVEDTAREAAIGIWRHPTQPPWDYRDDKWARAVAASPDGCPIKGNINGRGERIYHTPWSPNYWQTDIDTEKDERWFCNEGEALGAGWRSVR